MRFTDVEPDVNQLAEVLKSYGHPEIRVPLNSMLFGHTVPWEAKVEIIFDDRAPTLTPVEWRQQIITRLDVLFADLRSKGWELSGDSVDLNYRIDFARPRLTGGGSCPKLAIPATEQCTECRASFNLIPIWGELVG